MDNSRVTGDKVAIDGESIRSFYGKRAVEKVAIDVDAPVVLCADQAPEKVAAWTNFEVKERLPLLELTADSRVLELGFGTGRITKYLLQTASHYVGVDYVEAFVELVKKREDIRRTVETQFFHGSFEDLTEGRLPLPQNMKFDRFVIGGGVLVHINDEVLRQGLKKLVRFFTPKAVLYISEPIALEKRLTLNKFYSEELKDSYSAIYRTEKEYDELFAPFYEAGFQMAKSEEFFIDDIKHRKETRQWLFLLKRDK